MAEQERDFAWYELMTTDQSAAAAFYGKVTGWEAQPSPMAPPGMDYRLLGLPGQKHIDAFMGQQYRAFQLQVLRAALQCLAQLRRIGQRREQIGRDIEDAWHGARASVQACR